ncbi:hypothetical protein JWG39_01215 [Desulforhopalus vacuolatus]|uniref:hypothetical protein n=1 Tax=Desulforhopalus vacuolatus TaxID=40414 RepID=UPI0019629731|nr:hypothetical protein [Desulforhopalus vacuolatus]MBM9518432.1 hypothetical protein [Desulforhopalus vacuolatus]
MLKKILMYLLFCFAAAALSSCYNTPVRHLTSDIGMVKKGVSSEEDVLIYLGDPDKVEEPGDGRERWIYRQAEKTAAEKLPWVGSHFGSPQEDVAIITFTNKVVSSVQYTSSDPDEMSWEENSLKTSK